MRADLKDTITQLGIEYRLMTQFTSFVAVEEMIVTDGGQPRRIDVPVETPEGTFGDVGFNQLNTVALPKNMQYRVMAGKVATARAVGTGVAGVAATADSPPARADSLTIQTPMPVSRGVIGPTSVREELKDEALQQKLHRSLFAVVEKLQRKESLTAADEGGFIRNGKAEVQVWLTDKSSASLAKLKELGFEVVVDAKSSNLIIGRLPVEKIETLARLSFVKYVSPQISK